jgi:hypothetical protein
MPTFNYQSNFGSYKETFEEYVRVSRDTADDALDHQAQQLAFDLYFTTLSYTPGREFIMNIPQRVGWRIKRAPGWAVFATGAFKKTKTYRIKRWRKKDGTIVEKYLFKTPRTPASKPGEMERRAQGVGVTARSWLPRQWRATRGENEHWEIKNIRNPGGRVEFSTSGGELSITLINSYPGMLAMDQKFGIVAEALARRVDDMQVYIESKLAEVARQYGFA